MGIRRNKVLYNASAAGNGSWIALDTRYEKQPTRAIQGTVTAGDTITIQGITKETKGIDKSFLTTLAAEDITTLDSYTADFSDILNGNWTYIRAVKTGTTGTSKVQGFV